MTKRHLTAIILVLATALLMPLSIDAKSKAKVQAKTVTKVSARQQAVPASERAPEAVDVPDSVVAALASDDLNAALIQMREEKQTLKLKHLMNDATRAATFDIKKTPDKSEAHKAYQNVGISYHNLYLFLKRHGIEQKEYLKQAKKYYEKSRSTATLLHKGECDLLLASLIASSGDLEKAKKLFDKIDVSSTRGDFESMEYLATYYAASGQTEETLDTLATAHKMDPDRTLAWLMVGDDFANLEGDPRYQGLIDSWHSSKKDRSEVTLSVPKGAEPHLEMTSSQMQFAPQKMMKHASKKEVAELSKKSSKKSSKSKATVKKSSSSKKKIAAASKKTKSSAKKSRQRR
ncbi:MAG: hypothetical protein WC690_00065 [bacterium]